MEEKDKPTIASLLPPDEDKVEDEKLYAQLVGPDGKLKVDMGMPQDYLVDIMAAQMVDHMTAFEQAQQVWKSSRNQGNHAKAAQNFEQMQFSQLTVAIIQAQYPGAKKLAQEIMKVRAQQAQSGRDNMLKK